MLGNNNKIIIKKLSREMLKANKMRRVFSIIAITLTTLMLTVTMIMGLSFYKTGVKYNILNITRIDADGRVRVNKEQYEMLKKHKDVEDIGVIYDGSSSNIKNKEFINDNIVLVAPDNKDIYNMMAVYPVEGEYPKKDNEIFVPTWILDVLKVPHKVGEDVTLQVEINGEVVNKTFVLSGFFQSLNSIGSGYAEIYTSTDFVEKNNSKLMKSGNAYINLITLNSKSTKEEAEQAIENIAKNIGSESYSYNPKFDVEVMDSSNEVVVLAVVVGILLIILSGYLLIYNIFYIAVAKDIKFYGLLKTIGTTSKQIKGIIRKQGLQLAIIGIPIGWILGYILGGIVTPLALKETTMASIAVTEKSPIIFIVSGIFTLITLFISFMKPAKIASKVSPIEAYRYNSVTVSGKKDVKKGIHGGKIYKMAWRNILRDKKKVAVSILSISLSSTIFLYVTSVYMSLDVKEHANRLMEADFTVEKDTHREDTVSDLNPISQKLYDELENLDFIKDIEYYYSVSQYSPLGIINGAEILNEGKLKEQYDIYDIPWYYSNNNILADVSSIKGDNIEKELENLVIVEGAIDKEKFKTGKYLIFFERDGKENLIKAGDKINIDFVIRDKAGNEEIKREEFEIMAVVGYKGKHYEASNISKFTLEENRFKDIFKNHEELLSKVTINLKEGTDLKEANERINDIVMESNNRALMVNSKLYYIEGVKGIKDTIIFIGIIASIIIGAIGAINVCNTVLTGLFTRRLEFAMLESIGMTKKQLKKMIVFEGLCYSLLSLILILPLGFIVMKLAPVTVPIYSGFSFLVYFKAVGIVMLFITLLMVIVPLIGYKNISKDSIVERLRDTE